jgi:hypothetical protein
MIPRAYIGYVKVTDTFSDSSPAKRRETTAGPGVNLDSKVSGVAGGWE